MVMYCYSASTGGVYRKGFHSEIPDDALPISAAVYRQFFAEPLPAGKIVQAGSLGPVIVDSPKTSGLALAQAERVWRDGELSKTDGWVLRHRDEQEAGGAPTLTDDQYNELQAFRSSLRNWPMITHFPLSDHRPVKPAWMTITWR